MTTFSADVHHNEYLKPGATTIDALVRVTASGSAPASTAAAEILIVDVSGSMARPATKIEAAIVATSAAVDCIADGVRFGVLGGTETVTRVYPEHSGLVVATDTTRNAAKEAVKRLQPEGGTAIGRWLTCAAELFAEHPDVIHHAILLTDGKNESESAEELTTALRRCAESFQCDCRGAGEDWNVEELRTIASALLGTVDIIPDPSDAAAMTADFVAMMRSAMGKTVGNVALRIWTPRTARVEFVKQVEPSIEDLTAKCTSSGDLEGDYPTGAWGTESRDYHVRIDVPARDVGQEMLAGRVSVMVDGEAVAEAKIVAVWTDDRALSARIDDDVARATDQAELAVSIQQGIKAWEAGDESGATRFIGRAVQLADRAGDDDRIEQLRAFVEIDDAPTGKVTIRPDADKLAAMIVDTRSTKTVRRRTAEPADT
jgi:von Willebrand factor type A domain